MVEVENLTKRYGEKLAADGLDFAVQPGVVTGFLGYAIDDAPGFAASRVFGEERG